MQPQYKSEEHCRNQTDEQNLSKERLKKNKGKMSWNPKRRDGLRKRVITSTSNASER